MFGRFWILSSSKLLRLDDFDFVEVQEWNCMFCDLIMITSHSDPLLSNYATKKSPPKHLLHGINKTYDKKRCMFHWYFPIAAGRLVAILNGTK